MVEIVKRLSTFFGEAQGFATHRVVEYHHWIKAEQGRLLRAYAYLGERGEVQMDEGEPTEIEKAVMVPSGRESDEWYADEQDVMKIAAAWSYDPTELSESSGPPDYGFITGKPTLASKK